MRMRGLKPFFSSNSCLLLSLHRPTGESSPAKENNESKTRCSFTDDHHVIELPVAVFSSDSLLFLLIMMQLLQLLLTSTLLPSAKPGSCLPSPPLLSKSDRLVRSGQLWYHEYILPADSTSLSPFLLLLLTHLLFSSFSLRLEITHIPSLLEIPFCIIIITSIIIILRPMILRQVYPSSLSPLSNLQLVLSE